MPRQFLCAAAREFGNVKQLVYKAQQPAFVAYNGVKVVDYHIGVVEMFQRMVRGAVNHG